MNNVETHSINLAVSGWPGSGATSFALILSSLLKRKYMYIGDIFRYLGTELGHSVTGKSQAEFDSYIESIVGKTVDMYVDHKLTTESNLLLESDIAAFRIGRNPKIFSVFLRATYEERLRRVRVDGREGGEEYLKMRDDVLSAKYKELWDIDFHSEEMIARKYNLVLDNSNMTIENELMKTIEALNEYHRFTGTFDLYTIHEIINAHVASFWEMGKQHFKDNLSRKGLYYKPQEILHEITQEFPEDVVKFPVEVQNVFLGKKK